MDPKPIPLAQGHRICAHAMPKTVVERGLLGSFSGFALAAMDERGCLVRWAILSGNAREVWARELVAGLPNVLGGRGLRWVGG